MDLDEDDRLQKLEIIRWDHEQRLFERQQKTRVAFTIGAVGTLAAIIPALLIYIFNYIERNEIEQSKRLFLTNEAREVDKLGRSARLATNCVCGSPKENGCEEDIQNYDRAINEFASNNVLVSVSSFEFIGSRSYVEQRSQLSNLFYQHLNTLSGIYVQNSLDGCSEASNTIGSIEVDAVEMVTKHLQ